MILAADLSDKFARVLQPIEKRTKFEDGMNVLIFRCGFKTPRLGVPVSEKQTKAQKSCYQSPSPLVRVSVTSKLCGAEQNLSPSSCKDPWVGGRTARPRIVGKS